MLVNQSWLTPIFAYWPTNPGWQEQVKFAMPSTQVPPCWHVTLTQSSRLTSHVSPDQPAPQVHVKPPIVSWHVALFWQGFVASHSSMFASQNCPIIWGKERQAGHKCFFLWEQRRSCYEINQFATELTTHTHKHTRARFLLLLLLRYSACASWEKQHDGCFIFLTVIPPRLISRTFKHLNWTDLEFAYA